MHDDEVVGCRVGTAALGVEVRHWDAGAVHEGDLVARHGGVVGVEHGGDVRGDDQDYPERDDGAEVEHGSQHPSAMLVDLEAFDVVVRKAYAGSCNDHEQADCRLGIECPTEGSSADHDGTGVANEDEEDDHVAVDAVENEQFVSNDGDELPDHEEAGWQDGAEVDGDADPIGAGAEPVPLAGYSTFGIAAFGGARDVEVGETSQSEAHHRTCEDDDWGELAGCGGDQWIALTEWEVVSLLETERTVDLSPECHELVGSLLPHDGHVWMHCKERDSAGPD